MFKNVTFCFLLISFYFEATAQREIPLSNYFRDLKAIDVEINGKTYNFLFDTGGGMTLISPEIVKEINKTTYGNYIGFRSNGERVETQLCDSLNIEIAGVTFFNPFVGVFDIMSLLPKELNRIDGIISLKTFEQEHITLNLNENKLTVETEESYLQKLKKMTFVQSRFASGLNGAELNIFLGINSNKHLWWFLFDSGNITKTILSMNVAKELDLVSNENEIIENPIKLKLSGDSIYSPAVIGNILYDGVLSFDFIKKSEFLLSLKDKKVWRQSH